MPVSERAARAIKQGAPSAGRAMVARQASNIAPTRVSWLWPGWLPAGRLALFGGRPGEGKSAVMIDLAARLTTASPLPDGCQPPAPISVLLLSGEDDPSDTLVPRLLAAGADLERVTIANGLVRDNETGLDRSWTLPGDVDVLGQLVRDSGVDLAIVDPLSAFITTAVDTHRDASVRSMLVPLAQMARRERCAVLASRHHRKGGASDARDAGTGSIAFTAAARIEWVVGRDPQDQSRRVLAIAKTNIGREPPSLAYRLVQADCEWDTVGVAWQGQSAVTANQLVAEPTSEEDRSVVDEALE
ncbi:MAG TPA: AAA family ATPase, partial [Acidimicrobiales bacterium]|nr:AAA family ATPase [Acidimicrobiales bacterium]